MTPTKLKTYGEFLHGRNWQSPLSRDLGVSDRTIRNWASGIYKPSDCAINAIIDICAAKYVMDKALNTSKVLNKIRYVAGVPEEIYFRANEMLATLAQEYNSY